ncbi:hypothetical protein SEVIR_3G207000v4 [Setaria viridis]|uniref:Uncharacterized protein n=2 Tax=Setaria TaxID=4554 RepID=A0A368QHJ5_SETIT|nr:hypothetical protein SETIT_3G202100v2 [Setaria italica]TKW26693.1 hypothetical protein SEVIR_3G207000v2 [Setaria viridis]
MAAAAAFFKIRSSKAHKSSCCPANSVTRPRPQPPAPALACAAPPQPRPRRTAAARPDVRRRHGRGGTGGAAQGSAPPSAGGEGVASKATAARPRGQQRGTDRWRRRGSADCGGTAVVVASTSSHGAGGGGTSRGAWLAYPVGGMDGDAGGPPQRSMAAQFGWGLRDCSGRRWRGPAGAGRRVR